MKNSKGNRVFIVEDDLELSGIMEQVLKRLDARVELDWATSAEEAVAKLNALDEESERKPYDLIVADVFLEGDKTGLDLWNLCQENYPDVPFLVTSSMTMSEVSAGIGENAPCPSFLAKPFSIAECSEAMGEMLSSR